MDLLELISACALAPEQWVQALEGILDYLGGNGGNLFSIESSPEATGLWIGARLHPESVPEYVRYYRQVDVWTKALYVHRPIPPGTIYPGEMLVPRSQLHASEFYRGFLHRFKNVDLLIAILHDNTRLPVPSMALSIYRGLGDPPFGAEDIARLSRLVPHLQLATAVNFQLADRERRLEVHHRVLDVLCPPLMFVNPSGQILQVNRAAESLLAQRDGLGIKDGRLWAANRACQLQLQVLIGGAADVETIVHIPRLSGKPPYLIQRMSLPEEQGKIRDARRPHCALAVNDLPTPPAILRCCASSISSHRRSFGWPRPCTASVMSATSRPTWAAASTPSAPSLRRASSRPAPTASPTWSSCFCPHPRGWVRNPVPQSRSGFSS